MGATSQIIEDLRYEARQNRDVRPYLVLAVRPENLRAIRFYQRHGFEIIEPPMGDRCLRMAYQRPL